MPLELEPAPGPGKLDDAGARACDEPAALDEHRAAQRQAPLLLDVTPQTLRIETVAGFTEVVIERNAAIPVEQSRIFTTSQDFQEAVRARVCQGESRKLARTRSSARSSCTGLQAQRRAARRKIEVTFMMDADGTLQVRAKDMSHGQRAEHPHQPGGRRAATTRSRACSSASKRW